MGRKGQKSNCTVPASCSQVTAFRFKLFIIILNVPQKFELEKERKPERRWAWHVAFDTQIWTFGIETTTQREEKCVYYECSITNLFVKSHNVSTLPHLFHDVVSKATSTVPSHTISYKNHITGCVFSNSSHSHCYGCTCRRKSESFK